MLLRALQLTTHGEAVGGGLIAMGVVCSGRIAPPHMGFPRAYWGSLHHLPYSLEGLWVFPLRNAPQTAQ